MADEALVALNGRYAAMFAQVGRAPMAPEMVLRVSLLQAFFSAQVRPEACLLHHAAGAEADRL